MESRDEGHDGKERFHHITKGKAKNKGTKVKVKNPTRGAAELLVTLRVHCRQP